MVVEFNSVYLLKIKRLAYRKRVWFNVLNSAERALLTVVPLCMKKPRSMTLIKALAKIVVKIKYTVKNQQSNLVRKVGGPIALRLSMIAIKWGYALANEWATDLKFAKFLMILEIDRRSGGFQI